MAQSGKSLFHYIDLFDGNSQDIIEAQRIKDAQEKVKSDSYKARRARDGVIQSISIENKGVCEGCGEKDFIRWVDTGNFICYDCFYEDCQITGDMGYYHSRAAEDIDEYIDRADWEYFWAKENPHLEDPNEEEEVP